MICESCVKYGEDEINSHIKHISQPYRRCKGSPLQRRGILLPNYRQMNSPRRSFRVTLCDFVQCRFLGIQSYGICKKRVQGDRYRQPQTPNPHLDLSLIPLLPSMVYVVSPLNIRNGLLARQQALESRGER